MLFPRFDVQVAGPLPHSLQNHEVHEVNDRRTVSDAVDLLDLKLNRVFADRHVSFIEISGYVVNLESVFVASRQQLFDCLSHGENRTDVETGGVCNLIDLSQVSRVGHRHSQSLADAAQREACERLCQ